MSADGFPCPVCGKKSRVYDSRAGTNGAEFRRRRECPDNHRFSTVECVAVQPKKERGQGRGRHVLISQHEARVRGIAKAAQALTDSLTALIADHPAQENAP